MTKINNSDIHCIYLFDYTNKSSINPLKEFINFLKGYQGKKSIDFCYSCEKDSLHQNLNIKDNFILDAVPKSLIRDGEDNLKQYIKSLKNPYLKELVTNLGDLSPLVSKLNKDQLKMTSIIKALLSQSEYIFLLEPDQNMPESLLALVKRAMQFEVYQGHRKIIIKSENHHVWLDISGHIISKCDKEFTYDCGPNPILVAPTEENNIFTFPVPSLRAA